MYLHLTKYSRIPVVKRFVGQRDVEFQVLLQRLNGESMHSKGLWSATTVLKPSETGKRIYLPCRFGETLSNRRTEREGFKVTLEITRGCADRHLALKVALLENKTVQMLLQHLIIQSPFLKQPIQFLADLPKYWLENDGTMCLDDSHRWKAEETIAWLRKHGLHSVPNSIQADIGDLVYNGPKKTALDETSNFAPPPGRFVYFTGSRASNDPPPGL